MTGLESGLTILGTSNGVDLLRHGPTANYLPGNGLYYLFNTFNARLNPVYSIAYMKSIYNVCNNL